MNTIIEGMRSQHMERMTLLILVEAIKHVNPSWQVAFREDNENYLALGVQAEDGTLIPIARIYIVAVDDTGGEIDRAASEPNEPDNPTQEQERG